jgi:hypothetical protein
MSMHAHVHECAMGSLTVSMGTLTVCAGSLTVSMGTLTVCAGSLTVSSATGHA